MGGNRPQGIETANKPAWPRLATFPNRPQPLQQKVKAARVVGCPLTFPEYCN
jgi:hypothetical protein